MFIEEIVKSNRCVGCRNCENICPANSIKMKNDEEGFLVPDIDYGLCISCNQCQFVCPNYQLKYREEKKLPNAIILRNLDINSAKKSASGGLCTDLAYSFLETKGGYICGCIYDSSFRAFHIITNEIQMIDKMRGSKYVQSDLTDCFKQIKEKLNQNIFVLFIGVGCQVYALKKFLKKEYDNLYTIDLLCHGVPSPLVFKTYIEWLIGKYKKLIYINNRDKKLYLNSYVPVYSYIIGSGKKIQRRYSDDPMATSFYNHLSIRKCCFDCSFKTIHRISDLTIGDFWFSEQIGFGKDQYGVNLCVIQSEKGKSLLEIIKSDFNYCDIDTDLAVVLNGGMFYESVKASPNRANFFSELGKISFDKLVFKYDGVGKVKRLKYFLREIVAPMLRLTNYYFIKKTQEFNKRKQRKVPLNKKGLTYY